MPDEGDKPTDSTTDTAGDAPVENTPKENPSKAGKKNKAKSIDAKPVPFEYFLRFLDRSNHNKIGVCYGYLAELKKKGEDRKTKRLMKDWNKIIEKYVEGMGK